MKYLVALALAVCFSNVYAENEDYRWVLIAATNVENNGSGDFIQLDTKTVKAGTYPEAWTDHYRRVCSDDGGNCQVESRVLARAIYSCSDRKFAALHLVVYEKSETPIFNEDKSRSNLLFQGVIPSSSGEKTLEYVCKNYYKPSKKK